MERKKQMRAGPLEEMAQFRDRNLEALMEAKGAGRKVIGFYCTYSPVELALAAGAIAVPLCASRKGPLAAADNDLPQNLCPIVRTIYDVAVTDSCPFFHCSDLVIAETTCDGKKKMYELLSKAKPIHVMNLPQIPALPESRRSWESEIRRLKEAIEDRTGVRLTDEALRQAIHVTNEEARARLALFDLNRARPAPIQGRDLVTIASESEFSVDRMAAVSLLDRLAAEMAGRGCGAGTENSPRILLTGCPVGSEDRQIVDLVEEGGGALVAMENCGGYKTVDCRIDETDPRDPLTLLAEKYLSVPCSVMTPNEGRLRLLERMVRDFAIDGVIDLTWQACHTYNVESYWVADLVKNQLGLPFLHLETSYSEADSETLRVRIEAFLEMT
jgi:benzoyl-CoA reductase/2-hydroxyglutaryl-CoA dehydratase subunit BcrC/BadD/HgdB